VPLLVLYAVSYVIVAGVDRGRARQSASDQGAEPA
jgi:hypothetical protein